MGALAASPISFIVGLFNPVLVYPFSKPDRQKSSIYSLVFFPALWLILSTFALDLGYKPEDMSVTLFVLGILIGLTLPFLLPYLTGKRERRVNEPTRQFRKKTGRRKRNNFAFKPNLKAHADLPEGMSKSEFEEIIQQARRQIEQIRLANRDIASKAATKRMNAITDKAGEIIKQFMKDPSRIRRADKFLDIYLGSVAAISQKYAETHQQADCKKLDGQFLDLLLQIDTAFAEQKRQLMSKDVLHLDVDMELLSMRLKREGL